MKTWRAERDRVLQLHQVRESIPIISQAIQPANRSLNMLHGPTALMVFQMSLIRDYLKLPHKKLLPFVATELHGSGFLTYSNLGQRREVNLRGNVISFQFSAIQKNG